MVMLLGFRRINRILAPSNGDIAKSSRALAGASWVIAGEPWGAVTH
jgi:hypothetical protein